MRTAILLLLFIAFCPVTRAQKQADRSDLEFLITKVHQDYPGFHDKIKNEKIAELQSLEDRLKQKIGIYPDSGYFYLRSYAEYFKDYHLKVRRAGQSSMKLTKIPVSTYGESIDTGRLNISDYRLKTSGIEGVWRSWQHDYHSISKQRIIYWSGSEVFRLGKRPGYI